MAAGLLLRRRGRTNELIVAPPGTFLQQHGAASVSENKRGRLRLRLCRQALMGRTGFVLEHQHPGGGHGSAR